MPPPAKPVNLRFPLKGENRRNLYQSQPEFTTPRSVNVWPDDSIKERARGGSRPGLARAFITQVSGAKNANRLLNTCAYKRTSYLVWEDEFAGSALGAVWSNATGIGNKPDTLEDINGAKSTTPNPSGAYRDALASLDTAKDYTIKIWISPFDGKHHGTYQIYARMGSTPAVKTDGLIAELFMAGTYGNFVGSLRRFVSGTETVYTFTGGTDSFPTSGWFVMEVSGDNISCYWNGSTLLSSQAVGTMSGSRIGFGFEATEDDGLVLVDTFHVQYFTTTPNENYHNVAIASANGEVWKETTPGVKLTKSATSLKLSADEYLTSVESGQKLYVADWGTIARGTDGVRGTANNKFDSATYTDWTTLGGNDNDFVLEITGASGALTNGLYAITDFATSGELTTGTNVATGTGGTCTFRVMRSWKVYDPSADTLALMTSTAGTVPHGCRVIELYRGRLIGTDDPDNPNAWFASKQGDFNDWSYGDGTADPQQAVSSNTALTGVSGQPIFGCIAHKDDMLIFGTASQLWVLRGDPAFGGQLDLLDGDVGLLHRGGFARGPGGSTFVMSRDGLYFIAPGADSLPQPMSDTVIPRELKTISFDQVVHMVYDHSRRGIHLCLPKESGQVYHWFISLEHGGFYRVLTASNDFEPMCSVSYREYQSTGQDRIIFGCRDGYLRDYHQTGTFDDTTKFDANIIYGPFSPAGEGYFESMLYEIVGTVADRSANITWEVFVGDSHEQAVQRAIDGTPVHATGTWKNTYGRIQPSVRPMARGVAFCIRIGSSATSAHWVMEGMSVVAAPKGAKRLG